MNLAPGSLAWILDKELAATDGVLNDHFGYSVGISGSNVTASDGSGSDEFGKAVSISGGFAVIGSHWNDDLGSTSGSAYIFKKSGSSWIEQSKLLAADGSSDDRFGHSVAISENTILVGAIQAGAQLEGVVYTFEKN